MKSSSERTLWALVVILIGSPLTYVIAFEPGAAFWESAFSGLISTGAALIGGIPVAFGIDRALKRKEAEKEELAATRREKELLNLFKDELMLNIQIAEAKTKLGISVPKLMLQSNLWHACKYSGKLNDLRDISLLNDLSGIYTLIDEVIRIEQLAYKAAHSAAIVYPGGGGSAFERLMRDARHFDNTLLGGLNEIVEFLGDKIAEF